MTKKGRITNSINNKWAETGTLNFAFACGSTLGSLLYGPILIDIIYLVHSLYLVIVNLFVLPISPTSLCKSLHQKPV